MKSSAEVRWFYKQELPLGMKDWFCGSRLCKEEAARTDHYLMLPGSNEVGVKVRDGRKLEIKARTRMPQPFFLATGASVGRQDAWIKWSLDNPEAVGRLAAIGSNSPEWVPVTKKRWLREFQVGAAGEIEETDADAMAEHGCKAELCELGVRGSRWWSLAFESFGEVNRATNLEQVARHFLKVLPNGRVLTERDSMAYPEWLNRLAG
jgi:hypothetical protein